MGFSEIYLLGVDGGGLDSKEPGQRYNHIYNEDSLTSLALPKAMKNAYFSAKRYCEEHGIKVCNASRGGILDIFDRVDFDTLFDL